MDDGQYNVSDSLESTVLLIEVETNAICNERANRAGVRQRETATTSSNSSSNSSRNSSKDSSKDNNKAEALSFACLHGIVKEGLVVPRCPCL